jgi:serine/threonine protein kinase
MAEHFGKRYGRYVILERLGAGGMATVFNALDTRTRQNVALKVISAGKRTTPTFLQQFEQEAKTLASLTHSNIVKILDYGVQNGEPYLVMEYVPGGSLKDAMKHKIPWQTAAALLAPIAEALDYIHQQQIVHRDVKPSNILLQDDFRPMLADFGIVKLIESKDEKVDAAIMAGIGTPEYMPPEQSLGKEIDFRVDIYSLGVVFYEMVTGKKLYSADSPIALIVKHVVDKLPRPTKIDKNIPVFVEHVILRAIQKDPKNRFSSMAQFAYALQLIAKEGATSKGKVTRISRQADRMQRSRSIYLLSTVLILFMLGTSFLTYRYFSGNVPATALPTASQFASSTPTETTLTTTFLGQEELVHTATPDLSLPEETEVGPLSASTNNLPLLGTPIPFDQPPTFTEIARWGVGKPNIIRWSPDGKTIALGTTSGIFLHDSQTMKFKRFINTGFNVIQLDFRPTGDELAAGSPTGTVGVWNSLSGQHIRELEYKAPTVLPLAGDSPVSAIEYSQDGRNIVIGHKNGTVNYFAADKDTAIWEFAVPPTVQDLTIGGDGRFLYISNGTDRIDVWDVSDGSQVADPLVSPAPVQKLEFSSDYQFLLAGGIGRSIYVWDSESARLINSFSNLGDTATVFDFSFNGKYVAIGLTNGNIKIFETQNLTDLSTSPVLLATHEVHSGQIQSLFFAPDQMVIAVSSIDGNVKLIDPISGSTLVELSNRVDAISRLYFSNHGTWLATSHESRMVKIWDVRQAQEVFQIEGYLPKGQPFSPDNRFLAIVHPSGRNKSDILQVVDIESQKIIAILSDYRPQYFVQFREDTKLLVMGDTFAAKSWDVATWEELKIYDNPFSGCRRYITPESALVTTISNAGILFTEDEDILKMCRANPPGALLKYFFRNQNRLLFLLGDGRIWPSTSSALAISRIPQLGAHPSSDTIILAGDQRGWYAYVNGTSLYIRNISSSSAGTTLSEQSDYQYQVAFLPEHHLMALGSKYGSIHIWSMP